MSMADSHKYRAVSLSEVEQQKLLNKAGTPKVSVASIHLVGYLF